MSFETGWQGMKWIRHSTRLALYAASGFCCIYCGADAGRCLTRGRMGHVGPFSLDHLVPRAKGGGNDRDNLAMCCSDCNVSKGGRTAEEYIAHLAGKGVDTAPIRARIQAARDAALDRRLGRTLAARWQKGASLAALAKIARKPMAAAA